VPDDTSKRRPFLTGRSILVILIAALAIWLLGGLPWYYANDETAARFGDSFGAVNSLFSGFALAGVVIAILLQSQELALQREELEATREELKRAAEAQEASQKALAQQTELMFLSSYLTAVESIRVSSAKHLSEWKHGTDYEFLHQKMNQQRCTVVLDRAIRLLEKNVASVVEDWSILDSSTRHGAIDLLLMVCYPVFHWKKMMWWLVESKADQFATALKQQDVDRIASSWHQIRFELQRILSDFELLVTENPVQLEIVKYFRSICRPLIQEAIDILESGVTTEQYQALDKSLGKIQERLAVLVDEAFGGSEIIVL
jgi:hypothetical protein